MDTTKGFAKIIDKFILQSMKIEYGKAIPNECAWTLKANGCNSGPSR